MEENASRSPNRDTTNPDLTGNIVYVVLYYKSFGRFYDGKYLNHLVNQYLAWRQHAE